MRCLGLTTPPLLLGRPGVPPENLDKIPEGYRMGPLPPGGMIPSCCSPHGDSPSSSPKRVDSPHCPHSPQPVS